MYRFIAAFLLAAFPGTTIAEEWRDPGSPFMPGEAYPEVPATCDTIEHWVARAPDVDFRTSMAILGELSVTHTDGMLAYMVMCDEPGMQVLCVTYSLDGREVGDTVLFGGGYMGASDGLVILDPCLAAKNEPSTP